MAWYNFWKKERRAVETQPPIYSDSLIFGSQWRVQQSARSLSAVFACINLISNALSCMQFRVMEEDECGHRELVKHHPLQMVFKNKNIQTHSIKQIVKNVMEDVLLKGQGFIYINRNEADIITSLRYIPYSNMTVYYDAMKDTLAYSSTLLGNKKIPPRNVIHIKDITRDGVNGVSPLTYAQSVISLANAAEDSAKEFFDSGCNVNGLLTCQTATNDRQREQLKVSWSQSQGHKSLQVLPFGVNYHQIGADASKSQLLESREYEVVEICRYFGVNPMLIMDLSKNAYNSLEQVNLQFLQYTLMPFVIEFEQEFTRKCFNGDNDFVVDMDENSYLLRTDRASTADYYQKMVSAGIMSVNDARRELGMSEVDGGDSHTVAYSDATKASLENADKNKANNDGEDIQKPTDGTE